MPVFIVLSLCLSYLVETANPFQSLFISPLVVYAGSACAVASMAGIFVKRFQENLWYDIFFSSTLLTWFAAWKPLFSEDSPMFFFFPLYFALATAFVWLIVIGGRQQIDRQTYDYMRAFVEKSGIEPWMLMVLVMGSLELHQHFMLFPVLMTLLLIRFTLSGCIQPR
ncbi:MAG: hypothetical protein HOP23_07690 [Methylococcaceae bacterium]|nr:hypothetical protein [Methylococcaceae bacterium]